MMDALLGSALSQGLGYALFVVLFYYTLKKQDERDKKSEDREAKSQQREDKFQDVISTNQKIIQENQVIIGNLTENLDIVKEVKQTVIELKIDMDNIKDRIDK